MSSWFYQQHQHARLSNKQVTTTTTSYGGLVCRRCDRRQTLGFPLNPTTHHLNAALQQQCCREWAWMFRTQNTELSFLKLSHWGWWQAPACDPSPRLGCTRLPAAAATLPTPASLLLLLLLLLLCLFLLLLLLATAASLDTKYNSSALTQVWASLLDILEWMENEIGKRRGWNTKT